MLPGQLFLTTQIPACLWIISRNKNDDKYRDRRGETLFIDAGSFGFMKDRKTLEFSEVDIKEIAKIYHNWKSEDFDFKPIKGLCYSASIDEMRSHIYHLNPGRYIPIEKLKFKEDTFQNDMYELTTKLSDLIKKSNELDKKILAILAKMGFEL